MLRIHYDSVGDRFRHTWEHAGKINDELTVRVSDNCRFDVPVATSGLNSRLRLVFSFAINEMSFYVYANLLKRLGQIASSFVSLYDFVGTQYLVVRKTRNR